MLKHVSIASNKVIFRFSDPKIIDGEKEYCKAAVMGSK